MERQSRHRDQLKSTVAAMDKEISRLEVALRAEEAALNSARKNAEDIKQKILNYETELRRVQAKEEGAEESQIEEETASIVKEIAKIEGDDR